MKKKTATGAPAQRARRIEEHEHDPYHLQTKLHDPSICTECGVVFHKGRWQWWLDGPPDSQSRQIVCPACRRVRDNYPAGWVRLRGYFLDQHEYEILSLVQHQAEAERLEHPMNRIMDIKRENDEILITTTDIHTPRRIGEAIHHAYQGELGYEYEKDSYRLRVDWKRNE